MLGSTEVGNVWIGAVATCERCGSSNMTLLLERDGHVTPHCMSCSRSGEQVLTYSEPLWKRLLPYVRKMRGNTVAKFDKTRVAVVN